MAEEPEPPELDDLERWAAEARAREAAEARIRERWLRTQAEEDARFSQVLSGLSEQGATVTVSTRAGRHLAGRLARVGHDFLAVEGSNGRTTLVALRAVAWCRAARGGRRPEPTVGPDPDKHGEPVATLIDVLAQAVARRPRLIVHADAASLSGELRGAGVDVIVLETADEPPGLVYVRLASVSDISFLDSG